MTAVAGKMDAFENALLLLLFNNTNIANLGDATGVRGSSTAGSLYVALHTADPTEEGNQTSSECAYTNYARIAVARSSSGWTVTGNSVSPVANIVFAVPGSTTSNATFFTIGTASSGSGVALYGGAISPAISITNGGSAPTLTTGTTVTES